MFAVIMSKVRDVVVCDCLWGSSIYLLDLCLVTICQGTIQWIPYRRWIIGTTFHNALHRLNCSTIQFCHIQPLNRQRNDLRNCSIHNGFQTHVLLLTFHGSSCLDGCVKRASNRLPVHSSILPLLGRYRRKSAMLQTMRYMNYLVPENCGCISTVILTPTRNEGVYSAPYDNSLLHYSDAHFVLRE